MGPFDVWLRLVSGAGLTSIRHSLRPSSVRPAALQVSSCALRRCHFTDPSSGGEKPAPERMGTDKEQAGLGCAQKIVVTQFRIRAQPTTFTLGGGQGTVELNAPVAPS